MLEAVLLTNTHFVHFYFLCLLQLQKQTGIALLAISWCPEHARGPSGWFLGRGTHLTARIQRLFAGCFVFGLHIHTHIYVYTYIRSCSLPRSTLLLR